MTDDNEPEIEVTINLAATHFADSIRANPTMAMDFAMRAFRGIWEEYSSTLTVEEQVRFAAHVAASTLGMGALKMHEVAMPDELATWPQCKEMLRDAFEYYWAATMNGYEDRGLPAKAREDNREEREMLKAEFDFAQAEHANGGHGHA